LVGVPLLLFATYTDPIRWEWQTGYRTDHLHWHLQEGDGQNLKYLEFWENSFSISAIVRDVAVYAKAAGGVAGVGSTLSALGTFGYVVNLTPIRREQIRLIPFFGYGIDAEWLSHLTMKWFGPLIGGLLHYQPSGSLQLEACYAYHWENLRFHVPGVRVDDNHDLAQTGWIRMEGIWPPYRAGGLLQVQYFSSRFLPIASEVFKARWTTLSAAASFSKQF
jgi:hypothetical protein